MTVASCHLMARVLAVDSVITSVSLFTPGIPVVVISERFPEAGGVSFHEAQLSHPLRAPPEVQVRNEQARGTAVLGGEWAAIVHERDPRLAVRYVLERQIGGVP